MGIVIDPNEGTRLPGGFEVVIKVRSEATGGVMAVIEETIPAHQLISPHTHENDVWVYVLSGEIGVLVGDEIKVATTGSWALKPRNMLHAMWNAKDVPARIVEILTPGGTEKWFEELSALAPGDNSGWEELCRRYGIAFLPDSKWIPELKNQFDLQ